MFGPWMISCPSLRVEGFFFLLPRLQWVSTCTLEATVSCPSLVAEGFCSSGEKNQGRLHGFPTAAATPPLQDCTPRTFLQSPSLPCPQALS